MAKTPMGNQHHTVRCPYCGEEYATTYKTCPFCDGQPPEKGGTPSRRKHPKRTNNRGGGYSSGPSPMKIFTTILSLALIVAAVCIVVSVVKPMVNKDKPEVPPSQDPAVSDVPSTPPDAQPTPGIPADQTATGFTLSHSDFTTASSGESHRIEVTFLPEGSTGYIEWSSSNPEVVSVDDTGLTRAIGAVNGVSRAVITATLKGTTVTQTCIVRCSFDAPAGGAPVSPSAPPASGGSAKLNYSDFTMPRGTEIQLSVSGTSGTPDWSVGDTSVATVSDTGLVKMVGKGNTKVTCTVNGQTLTCVVRCSG